MTRLRPPAGSVIVQVEIASLLQDPIAASNRAWPPIAWAGTPFVYNRPH